MKTLADFKRKCEPGFCFTIYQSFRDGGETRSRIVNFVQSNSVCFAIDGNHSNTAHGNRSWFEFPKAKDCTFLDGAMIVWTDAEKSGWPANTSAPRIALIVGDTMPQSVIDFYILKEEEGRAAAKKELERRQSQYAKA